MVPPVGRVGPEPDQRASCWAHHRGAAVQGGEAPSRPALPMVANRRPDVHLGGDRDPRASSVGVLTAPDAATALLSAHRGRGRGPAATVPDRWSGVGRTSRRFRHGPPKLAAHVAGRPPCAHRSRRREHAAGTADAHEGPLAHVLGCRCHRVSDRPMGARPGPHSPPGPRQSDRPRGLRCRRTTPRRGSPPPPKTSFAAAWLTTETRDSDRRAGTVTGGPEHLARGSRGGRGRAVRVGARSDAAPLPGVGPRVPRETRAQDRRRPGRKRLGLRSYRPEGRSISRWG